MKPKQNKTRSNSVLKQKNKQKKIEAIVTFCFRLFFSPRFGAISFLTPTKKKEGDIGGVAFFDAKKEEVTVALPLPSLLHKNKKKKKATKVSPSSSCCNKIKQTEGHGSYRPLLCSKKKPKKKVMATKMLSPSSSCNKTKQKEGDGSWHPLLPSKKT
jgi:hypothetical protein